MKLRTRLFIIVGSLFIAAFVISYFLENRLVRTHLMRAEDSIRNQIISLNEGKRENIEKYLGISLAETEAQLDSLLQKIAEYPIVGLGFAPNAINREKGTWLQTATLMANNKWLDLVQNVLGDQVASLVIDDLMTATTFKMQPINENLAIGVVASEAGDQILGGPYFALRFFVDQYILDKPMVSDQAKSLEAQLPALWLLFTPDAIEKYSIEKDLPSLDQEGHPYVSFWHLPGAPTRQQLVEEIRKEIEAAKAFLAQNPSLTDNAAQWQTQIAAYAGSHKSDAEKKLAAQEREVYEDLMNQRVYERFLAISSRLDDLGLIWSLSATYSMGIFGYSPFGPLAPVGIARTLKDASTGRSMYVTECFHDKPFVDSFSCDKMMAQQAQLCLGKKMRALAIPNSHRFFFANTLRLTDPSDPSGAQDGYLTIGKEGNDLLQNLALVTHQVALFISGEQILKAYGPDGQVFNKGDWSELPLGTLLDQKTGLINFKGTDYFFLHMDPFPDSDFHFLVLNTKDKEFALVDSLDESANALIATIGLNMRLVALGGMAIVLLLLSNVARRITKPITVLADAAKAVAQGHLEEIHLTKQEQTRQDEISQLYQSFHEMVEGLKEKERVRGVLNKVVSGEIADEILKGNVQLGGEVKEVTVLFADVRSFTHITEKMTPQEVVTMLNTCMTRISRCIDRHKGVIDKFVGDEVMALFGAPVTRETSPYDAILSAIDMIEALHHWNQERAAHGEVPIEMGIGIHTGNVLAGNMGAENRLNYTVLGSNVNLASRLCSAAKPMEILISKSTYELPSVKEHIAVEAKEAIELKGFTEPIPIFRVLGRISPHQNE